MKYWFTSDTHFGHFNIIRYAKRPFKSLEHMNETLIRNWNSRVSKDDVVLFIGDFCFKNSRGSIARGEGDISPAKHYESLLNGKIIFVKGNHDNNNSLSTPIERIALVYCGKRILLVHNPAHIGAEDGLNFDLVLCGHVHDLWKETKICGLRVINVGVDVNGFMPRSLDELLKG